MSGPSRDAAASIDAAPSRDPAPGQTGRGSSEGTAVCRTSAARYRAIAVADVSTEWFARVCETPEILLDESAGALVKRGRSALVMRAGVCLASGTRSAACKRMGSRNWIKRVARGVRPDRAIRNFWLGHALLRRGIATPRPLLAVAPRWRAFARPSFLATEWIDDALPLDAFVQVAGLGPPGAQRDLRAVAGQVGRLVGSLHVNGFAHRDLKAANVLARVRNRQAELFVIDLDGAARPLLLTERTRLSNLARLDRATRRLPGVTRATRLRALRSYLASFPEKFAWKSVWRQVGEKYRIRPPHDRRAFRANRAA